MGRRKERPLLVSVTNFHKKLHQPLDRKDFHQDGLLINDDQPFEIALIIGPSRTTPFSQGRFFPHPFTDIETLTLKTRDTC